MIPSYVAHTRGSQRKFLAHTILTCSVRISHYALEYALSLEAGPFPGHQRRRFMCRAAT